MSVCVSNPGHIKLQGVLLDFYVNNVNQHMAGRQVVDAPLIKWGHLLYQQDLTQPEMRAVLCAVCCYKDPFTQNAFDYVQYFALAAKVHFFMDFHKTVKASHFHLQYVTTTSEVTRSDSIYDSLFYQAGLHAAQ